jgi:hypothetical protein
MGRYLLSSIDDLLNTYKYITNNGFDYIHLNLMLYDQAILKDKLYQSYYDSYIFSIINESDAMKIFKTR